MKNFNKRRLLGLMFAGCLGMSQTPTVLADAGDTIDNQVTLSFTVGGTPQTDAVSNVESFVEDRVINFMVAEVGSLTTSVTVSPVPTTLQVQEFSVTNNSNSTMDFLLAAINNVGGLDPYSANLDNFDPSLVRVFAESGGGAGYQDGVDTALTIDNLAEGAAQTVYIVSTIQDDTVRSNGDIAVLSLVAQAADAATGTEIMRDDNNNVSPAGTFSNGAVTTVAVAQQNNADTAAMETVFNDPAGVDAIDVDSAGVAQDVARNGQHSDSDSYTVAIADLTVTKSSNVIYDPVNLDDFTAGNNPKAIPGAYVQYTITIANAATAGASADLTTLTDALQSAAAGFGELDLDPNLLDAGKALTASLTFPADAEDGVSGTGIHVSVTSPNPTRTVNNNIYCTGDVAPGDGDGCSYTGAPGGTVTVDLATVLAAEAGYTAGELKPDETVTIRFNAIVQ